MNGTSTGREILRSEIRLNWDGGDLWGSVLSNLGGLCDVLYLEGGDIPSGAGYSPGGADTDLGDYPAAIFDELLSDGTITIDDLEYWARVLDRAADLVPKNRRY